MPGKSTSSTTTSHGACPASSLYSTVTPSGAVSISTLSPSSLRVIALEMAWAIAWSSSMIRTLIGSAIGTYASTPPGQPNEERRTITRSTIHDPTVMRFAREAAEVQAEAAFAVRSFGVLAEQVALELGGH